LAVATKNKKDLVREQAEQSLEAFIKLVHPQRVLGAVHKELISWWTRSDSKSHQIVLLPRDHQKSAMVAYRVAWEITKDPTIRVLYLSSTSNLATKQLKFIKDIFTSDIYRFYWPEMVNEQETAREKWTEFEISVDHPRRKQEAVRDPTIFTAGLTTSITGLHCDISVLDDVVVGDNAYTEEGRLKTRTQISYIASIEAADARQWVVGTRYHPKDLYNDQVETMFDIFDEDGEVADQEPLFEKFERQVESRGDGAGEFIWPRQQRTDGKWFGFDQKVLARKKAQYYDQTQFRAQYYNDPNDLSEAPIDPSLFQYYERSHLSRVDGRWFYRINRLNVFAAIDFAYSLSKESDYSAIVVVGVDSRQNYYVLDIERFKTNKIGEYFDKILRLHQKWDFRKLRAEVTSGQQIIVKDLKDNYIRKHGLALTVDEHRPTKHTGKKEERIDAALQPRYQNHQVWHYLGGNCQTLEEELVLQNPPHDDIKDALACVIDICIAPAMNRSKTGAQASKQQFFHSRFGGVC
jgi:phage terminase large subunit-like protein